MKKVIFLTNNFTLTSLLATYPFNFITKIEFKICNTIIKEDLSDIDLLILHASDTKNIFSGPPDWKKEWSSIAEIVPLNKTVVVGPAIDPVESIEDRVKRFFKY